MKNIEKIEEERARQINVEGWTSDHDDWWVCGELMYAASMYYQSGNSSLPLPFRSDSAPIGWPWDAKWWKPKSKQRDLVRAGALCFAEWERLIRAGEANLTHGPNHLLKLVVEALNRLEPK